MGNRRKYRCEHCLNKFYSNLMTTYDGLHLCVENCLRHYSHERCEGCYRLYERETIVNGQCESCRNPKKKWFAISTYMSDNKVAKAIRQHFRNKLLSDQIGRILIPKVQQARRTLNRYDVYDVEDKCVGQVSAQDSEDALFKAQAQFGRPKKRTLYRPEAQTDKFEKVEKIKEGRKVYYCAISDSGRTMGRVSGYRSAKKAEEALRNLYDKQVKNNNPREQSANPADVKYVKLAEVGGKVVVQNKRAMSGYVLIEMWEDSQNFIELSKCRGVGTVLPYANQIPERSLGRFVCDGTNTFIEDPTGYENLPPDPISISEEEIEVLVKKKGEIVTGSDIEVGNVVTINSGSFKGMKATVESVDKKTLKAKCSVMVWGRAVRFDIACSDLLK